MAASFRSVATATNGHSSTITVNRPTGTVAGDLLLAFVALPAADTVSAAPSGWTQLAAVDTGGATANIEAHAYWRLAAGGDPSSWTWTFSGSADATALIVAYQDASTGGPIDVSASSSADPGDTTIEAPSVTTTHTADLLVTGYAVSDQVAASFTPPSGMTERADFQNGRTALGLADVVLGATGATGTKTATVSSTPDSWAAFSVAIASIGGVVVANGIPSGEAVGQPTIAGSGSSPIVIGAGIASAEAVGSPAVISGKSIVVASGIPSAEVVGQPEVAPVRLGRVTSFDYEAVLLTSSDHPL